MLGVLHTQLRRKYNSLKYWADYVDERHDELLSSEQWWKIECEERDELIEELREDIRRMQKDHYDWVKELEVKENGIEE